MARNRLNKRLAGGAALLMSALLVLSGCGGASSGGGGGGDNSGASTASKDTGSKTDAGPTPISMLLKYYSAQPPDAQEAFKLLQEHTNTKLNITWAPNPSYDDKVNTTLASGNLPEVILVNKNKADNMVEAVSAGAFWELGPYIKNYPNLAKINHDTWYNVSYDGKIFSIPSTRSTNETAMIIRKDWLDNLGLKMPTTVDELYNTIKAFKNNDPDKNGQNDTVGVVETSDGGVFSRVAVWLGAPKGWGVKDGQLSPDFMSKEYLDAMNFMRKLYQEKLVNEDFAVVTQNQLLDYINKGKGGLYAGAFAQLTNGWFNPLAQANPKAKLTLFDRVKGPSGDYRQPSGPGFNGVFMIPKSSVKSEDKLKSILGFFDKLADDDMQKLIALGIEGKHYKMENGKPVVTDDKAFTNDVVPLRWIMVADGITGRVLDTNEEIANVVNDKELKMISDPTVPFTTKTIVDQKIIDDARTKYIMGQLDLDGWNAAIDKWRKNNGDKLIKEYNDQYAKIKK